MGKKVIAAGHICLDITPAFPNRKYESASEILQPGKLIHMGKADVHVGGSVANTGLAMKILGAEVVLAGKVGDDIFGEIVLESMRKYDAGEEMLVAPGMATAHSVILAIPGIDRIFLHHPGVNDTFSADDISEKLLEDTTLFHFGYPTVMKKFYENEGEELLHLLKKVKEKGIATSVDMAAVDGDSPAASVCWEKVLEKTIPYIDIFMPSAEELCVMVDKNRLDEWKKRAGGKDITEILDIDKDIRPLADRCFEMGAKILVIKCGVCGMYYRTAESERMSSLEPLLEGKIDQWTLQEGFEKSYKPDKFLSGTGAGDTSIAAFLTALLKGYGLKECVQLAAATGAACVSEYDALSGLQSLEVLEQKIRSGWPKIEI